MKKFDIPSYYRSDITGHIKEFRKQYDPRKKDFSPTKLDFGPVLFFIARHFGFCYGVENAIEISYKALDENPNKKVYLLSQMIHNQEVNQDLQHKGIQFIMDTDGTQLIPWENITPEDIVIIPAFGTTLEIEQHLKDSQIEVQKYNTTCPFVEKVWNRSEKLAQENFTIIIHGKPNHEETRATFSHSKHNGPSIVVRDIAEAKKLGEYLLGQKSPKAFYDDFKGKISADFDPTLHLQRVGVVNQTTMLAAETQEIAEYFKLLIGQKFGNEKLKEHFADTRDTLCYATNDNQDATYELLKEEADLALVVGGYNSSNTSHIVELCEKHFPTYFISSKKEILSQHQIQHFDFRTKKLITTSNFIPAKNPLKIVLTSGASCPDTLVDQVMERMLEFFENTKPIALVLTEWKDNLAKNLEN